MKGLTHIIYGMGKGKTTGAVGCALRAAGSGMKVVFVSLMKDGTSSENSLLEKCGIKLMYCDRNYGFTFEMTDKDKAVFLEKTKRAMTGEQGIPWEIVESKILEEIENTFDDEKILKMDPDFRIDAAFARKEFGDRKPALVDYMLWSLRFVTKSEYVDL